MAGKRSKTYELMIEVAGRVSKNFNASIGNAEKRLGGLSGVVGKVSAALGTVSAAKAGFSFLQDSVEQAIAFESTMADVAKVVDGLRDENGRLTESYYQMSDAILEMTTRIPMSKEAIGEIISAAGQAGIAREDLLQFAEDAAKMGIAFDTTADQAGEWMAVWRTSFGMTQSEVVALADQINYLGNTTSENTLKLSGVVTRIGALGKTAGLSAAEVAAMAASMTGVTEEISATGIKNLMLTMTAGSAATDTQRGVLKRLGMDAENLAERMQVDAQGAILELLGAIKKLAPAEQTAMLSEYFGKESVAAIAPLLSNLGYLEEQFKKIGDATLYAGSMEAEYAARSDTTDNKTKLALQNIDKLKTELGGKLLPVIGNLALALSNGIEKASAFFETHKWAMPTILAVTGSLLSMLAAHKALSFATANGAMLAGGFGSAIGFLKSPIGIAIVAITGLIAMGVALYKNWDTVKAKAEAIWGGIKSAITSVKEETIADFHEMIQAGKEFLSALDQGISSIPVLGSLYNGGKTVMKAVGSKLMERPVPALASGGIATAPTFALIGEGRESEAVLPLSKLGKMLEMNRSGAVAQKLPEFEQKTQPEAALQLSSLEQKLESISSGNGGEVVFAPKIEIKGNVNKEDVVTAMRMSFEEFKQFMKRYERDRRRFAF